MPEGRNGTFNRLAAVLGLLAVAFWAGDFAGQWRTRSGLESDIAALRSEVAVQRAKLTFHDNKDGHSEVIERLTALETWKAMRYYRSPLGDME